MLINNYKKSLIEPLIGEELHIFHSNAELDRVMRDIVDIIQHKVHGCYLLGGFRGTGKTSLLNLCCAKFGSKHIKLNLDCNKLVDAGHFLFFFASELVKIADSIPISEQLKTEINKVYEQVTFRTVDRKSQISINKVLNNHLSEDSQSGKGSVQLSLWNKLFGLTSGREFLNKLKQEENNAIESSQLIELEARNDEFILVDRLSDILRRLAKEEGYQLVIVIDEIDKQDNFYLRDLFSKYKNLFLNSHLISFFVVDQNQYQEIAFGSDLEDRLKIYFTRLFYLPTFSLEDIKNYLYREFEVDSISQYLKAAYLTTGVIRKMNTFHYLEGRNDPCIMSKTGLYHDLLESPELLKYKTPYIADKCKFIIKEFVELLFYRRKMDRNQTRDFFREKFDKHNLPLSSQSLSSFVLDATAKSDNFAVERSSAEEWSIELEPKVHGEYLMESEEKINFSKELRLYHNINRNLLKFKADPIKITERDYQGFDHFIRIIETNFRSVKNIFIVKKITNWEEREVANYSAILLMEKPVGPIIYCAEECSFSYEGSPVQEKLIDFMKENKIRVIMIETDDEPIAKSLDFILEQADKIIYKG